MATRGEVNANTSASMGSGEGRAARTPRIPLHSADASLRSIRGYTTDRPPDSRGGPENSTSSGAARGPDRPNGLAVAPAAGQDDLARRRLRGVPAVRRTLGGASRNA